MKSFLLLVIYLLWLRGQQGAPTKEEDTNVENLKVLSEVGEKYVDEEVKKALIGIKQMKILMERNEAKHMDLMKTLKKSSEEKEEALRLMSEVKERLEEEETTCQESLQHIWDECKSCLESNCMRFYTTCRRGLSSFTSKIQDFFRKMTPVSISMYETEGKEFQFNQKPEKEDVQLVQMENLFNQLLSDVGTLFEKSFMFFKQMQKEFDQSFQMYFMSNPDITDPYFLPTFTEDFMRNSGFPKEWGVQDLLQLVFDFSKTVIEGVSEMLTETFEGYTENEREMAEQIKDSDKSGMFSKIIPGHERAPCNKLRQNSSGCSQFHERCQKCQDTLMQVCPSVPELHVKFDDTFKLVNISAEQYQQILQMVQRHTEDTSYLLNKMKERFGWVSELSNRTIGPENIFNIVKVASDAKAGEASGLNETVVDVNILTSPTFTIKVPQELDTRSTEFIEYVAEKALQLYKKNF
ncbi:clusterin-like protein 1 [Eublepharis macularius]|uniref:Clusterin n=1 Tax=Eublepharis macularius TaxID=481883 RepID=A0AA97JQL9_EUBMA|nr:clusterin-like protein 1 [Eublepharis macularius]